MGQERHHLETLALHAGQTVDADTGSRAVTSVNPQDPRNFARAIQDNTRLVYIETIADFDQALGAGS